MDLGEMLAMIAVIAGAALLFFGNITILEKMQGGKTESTDIVSLIKSARENGKSSGIITYAGDICLDDFLKIKVPCRNEEGIFARHAYCFKKNVFYSVNVTRNDQGGVCIEVAEVD